MKKICVLTMLILSSTMSFADTWDGHSSDTSWYAVNQTAFHISSAAQLKGLADLVNDSQVTFDGCNVYLDSDIDLDNKQWTPIGFGNTSFSGGTFNGTFCGNKHAISNMYIDTSALPNSAGIMTVGLFGNMKGTVTSLSLTAKIDINKGYSYNDGVYYVGGLVATGENIDHVFVTTTYNCNMTFFNKNFNVGFVAGKIQNISYAESDGYTYFYGTSYQSGLFGGIAGEASVVTKCASKGGIVIPANPSTNSRIGGIAGVASTVSDCIVTGKMSVYTYSPIQSDVFLGGICAGYDGTISNVIFVPSSYETNIGALYKGMITPKLTSFTTTNAYYNSAYAGSSEADGTPVTEEFLLSGEKLNGFSSDIWEFNRGEYPYIKELKNNANEPINGIAIDETNFPDANFRTWLLKQDYGKDGVLTENEIAEVTRIDLSNKSITSLKGMEYFTALTYMDCRYNQLAELDVSKNTLLTYLDCSNNQLMALDVLNNAALTALYCSSNQFTTLDVSNNTALIELNCVSNQLTTLNVANSTALTVLACHNNQLTALDVSNNTALTRLSCSENKLTDIDVSKNMALTRLYCDGNQLMVLDVSNNTDLMELRCNNNYLTELDVSKNTALTEVYCYSNQLTTLDVSNNTALNFLWCSDNQLTSLEASKALTSLYCYNNQIAALDLSGCIALTYFHCYNNQIKGKTMDALINSLPQKNWAYIYVYYEGSPTEGNVMSKSQVAAAKTKGWKPSYTTDGQHWYEYEGSEDEPTEPISITLPEMETVNVNSFVQLTPTIEPADAVTDLTWSSDDESIAKVTSKGLVAGIKPGTAIISVRTSNNLIAECFVIVQDVSGIEDVNAGDGSNKTVYTISGQKVTRPMKGGIYIVNGKKVVMK